MTNLILLHDFRGGYFQILPMLKRVLFLYLFINEMNVYISLIINKCGEFW
jgi:hypothetical protein